MGLPLITTLLHNVNIAHIVLGWCIELVIKRAMMFVDVPCLLL